MDYDFPKSTFYRAMMTGFFVGFVATVVCLTFNIIYRDSTGFPLNSFINVSTIIFLVNLLFPAIGIIYYGLITALKKADPVFLVLCVLLFAFCIWKAETVHRTSDPHLNSEFKILLLGIVIILGIATFLIPLLYHSKKFEETVL